MLNLSDLGAVLTELYSIRDKWYNIGLQLKVPVTELQRIESEHKNDHTTCLRLMLTKWLESGCASWRSLCDALRSPIVLGDDAALVSTLIKKYCEVGHGEKEPSTKKRKLNSETATTATTKVLCRTYYHSLIILFMVSPLMILMSINLIRRMHDGYTLGGVVFPSKLWCCCQKRALHVPCTRGVLTGCL